MAQLKPISAKTKNGDAVELRSPKSKEGAEILSLVKEIMARSEHLLTEADEFTYTVEQEEEMIRSFAADPNKLLVVPVVDGKIMGVMNFAVGHRRRISHQGEFGMSIHPDCQGQGIGRLMLQALIDWATEHPRIECLRLRVHAKNAAALALYRKCGFVEEGREIRGVKLGKGRYDDVLTMARVVKPV